MDKIIKGYVCQISIPESCNPKWDEVNSLAQLTGYDQEYLPRPKSARAAWEIATNLPKRGEKVPPSFSKKKQILKEYGVEPVVRIKVEIVSASAPVLRRSLVQYVYIPQNLKDDGLDSTKQKYLNVTKLAMLEFDTETNSTNGYIFGNTDWVDKQTIQDLVNCLKRYQMEIENNCIANDIRSGLRRFFDDLGKVALVKKSGYYIPDRPGTGEKLAAMRSFVRGLAAFSPADPPLAYVFKVAPDDSDAAHDLKLAAIEHLSSQLFELQAQAQRFIQLDNKKSQKKVDNLLESLIQLQSNAKILKESINDELEVLNVLFNAAKEGVLEAQSQVEE